MGDNDKAGPKEGKEISIIATILAKILAYLTSIWGVARMVFSHLPVQVMEDVFGLLCIIFLINIIDSLPTILSKKKAEKETEKKEEKEVKDEYFLVKRV